LYGRYVQELLILLLVSGALSEAPAPYAPSGWRPSGPAFELPSRAPSQIPQRAEYLPPVDPRTNRPLGFDPVADVSVQGLPTQEQLPIFQVSPINGQQYVGPNFNSDIKGLESNFQESQLQQEKARQLSRQQQFPANPNAASGLPNSQSPRQFAQTTSAPSTTARPKQAEPTTEPSLNKDEKLDKEDLPKKAKISVEVSKQNLQEYPPEFFLSSLAQLQLQPQFVPLQQFGQIREQVFYQPPQQGAPAKQTAGYDGPTHFAAFPSVLAQNQIAPQQQTLIPAQQVIIQKPALLVQQAQQPANPIIVQAEEPLPQYQPVAQYQPIAQPQLNQEPLPQYQPVNQYQPIGQPQFNQEPLPQYQPVPNQYQPALQAQEPLPQYQPVNQYQPITPQQYPQATPVVYQPQANLPPQNPEAEAVETNNEQPQYIYQQSYQPQELYQPQQAYQPQIQTQYTAQQGFIPQSQANYPQDLNQYYQNQFPQQFPNQFGAEPIVQGQDSLQSGLDVSKEDNGIDQEEQEEEEIDDGTKATAVATAFGTRTQPRVFSQYGVPASSPRDQANRGYQTTTESDTEETTEEAPAIAQATAVATPSRNRSAKLRSRRPRPLFTVDRSGHLVLAKEQ
ncbi:RNA polymerase II degradation factor 1-like, partial [Papilio machaon]|uniref:RNA polymerase II degradation factor 1-like n=1 Tax=Papilio machaon TaxID=76193 RepID=UPI001E665177